MGKSKDKTKSDSALTDEEKKLQKEAEEEKQQSRWFAFVCYPESLPNDWLEYMIMQGQEFAISPLHDKDIDPTGEPKKPHYHVMIHYNNTTPMKTIKRVYTDVLGQPRPITLRGPRGMFRYFSHMDNPDKYQYDRSEIRCFNGFDGAIDCEPTAKEKAEMQIEIMNMIEKLQCRDYIKFMQYIHTNRPDLLVLALASQGHIKNCLSAVNRRYKEEQEYARALGVLQEAEFLKKSKEEQGY